MPIDQVLLRERSRRNIPTPIPINNELFNQIMTPVIVYPTEEQINRSSRFIAFDNIQSPINSTCPITHESFSNEEMVLQLSCGHIFNNEAIRIWFQSNVRCPICRYDIRDIYRPSTSSRLNPARSFDAECCFRCKHVPKSGPEHLNRRLFRSVSCNKIRLNFVCYLVFPVFNKSV